MTWDFKSKKELGQFGEKIAEKFLRKKGYEILTTNFRLKWGEIDIVARKQEKIVFFEVKTIFEKQGFLPEDQITPKKKRNLQRACQIFLSQNNIPLDSEWQIDVLAIEISRHPLVVKIRHFENAIGEK